MSLIDLNPAQRNHLVSPAFGSFFHSDYRKGRGLWLLAGLVTWVPGTRMAQAEKWLSQVILWILYARHGTFCMPLY